MPKQLVELIDRAGHVVHSYTVELEHAQCIDAEFEEVALILGEKRGVVPAEEYVHIRARCVK